MNFMFYALLSIQANATGLDAAIESAASRHQVCSKVLKAIAFIESSQGRNVRLNKNTNGTYDIGPFQINSIHWNTTCKDLDLTRTQDNADCAARLLKIASKHESSDAAWVGRYHSKTPSLKLRYANKVDNIIKKERLNHDKR